MRRVAHRVQAALLRAGVRVSRGPANRFDAMDATLRALAARGFAPTVIIDAGANVGAWSRSAASVFPGAAIHAIEPQPACAAPLAAVQQRRPSLEIHAVALTRPGRDQVRMSTTDGSTGAWVLGDRDLSHGSSLSATTLDALIADRLRTSDRVLLKLDLEGHELEALAGAERTLRSVEAVITEVQFYDVDGAGHPTFDAVASELQRHEFVLYDIVGLASRPRDGRLRMGDVLFVRRGSRLLADGAWA